jgi:hypothetical protein
MELEEAKSNLFFYQQILFIFTYRALSLINPFSNSSLTIEPKVNLHEKFDGTRVYASNGS